MKTLSFLDEQGGFSEMNGGYLQVILTVANYVLRDPSVNLSIKEKALIVAQDILDMNNQVKMIDLVRISINMLKTNYISSNLGGFLRKLLMRTNKVEQALLLN